MALNAWGGGKKGGKTALTAGAKRKGGGMKGLRVAAGSCSGWLGTDSPPSSNRALKPVPEPSSPGSSWHGPHPGGFGLDTFRWDGVGCNGMGEKRAGRKQDVPCEEGQPEEGSGQQSLKRKNRH